MAWIPKGAYDTTLGTMEISPAQSVRKKKELESNISVIYKTNQYDDSIKAENMCMNTNVNHTTQ